MPEEATRRAALDLNHIERRTTVKKEGEDTQAIVFFPFRKPVTDEWLKLFTEDLEASPPDANIVSFTASTGGIECAVFSLYGGPAARALTARIGHTNSQLDRLWLARDQVLEQVVNAMLPHLG